MRSSEGGFTLVEVLVAVAIAVLTAFTALAICRSAASVLSTGFTTGRDVAALDAQATRLRDEAAAAFAVDVPPAETSAGGTTGGARELDFAAADGNGAELRWRYLYDAERQTLQRYDIDPGGAAGVRDPATGAIDTRAHYPALHGVTAFSAALIPADRLADAARNRYSGLGALFARPPHAYAVAVGGAAAAPMSGGNGIVEVTLRTARAVRVIHLATAALPSGFTVTGLPRWHAVLYRVDQTHRFLFGFAGKSHVFINARIDVTYDDWKTQPPKAWCIFNVLGNPDGLDPHDPHADYKPDESFETAEALLARCRELHPTPPPRDRPGNPPEPGVAAGPLPGPTPPACWTHPGPAGRCWPAGVPADWAPPSPVPHDTPPPAWCTAHGASEACAPRTARIGER